MAVSYVLLTLQSALCIAICGVLHYQDHAYFGTLTALIGTLIARVGLATVCAAV
jgi:hypothetical protein